MKKILSILLSSTILLSALPVFAENDSTSIGIIGGADGPTEIFVSDPSSHLPSSWAEKYIAKAISIAMTDNLSTAWRDNISREEFCELAYNMLDAAASIEWKSAELTPFTDTDNEKIIALYLEGIINGKSETEFAPNDTLTREEAAAILQRIAAYMNLAATQVYYTFDDESEISDWASNSIQIVCNMGIMNGIGDNKFDPKGGYTTEQAVTTLVRLYDIITLSTDYEQSFADKINSLMPDEQNYMFSPLSVKYALMMAANGAEGETQQEILDAIGVNDIDEYNAVMQQLIKNFSQSDLLRLNISNSIWLNTDNTSQKFSDEYSKKMAELFNADSKTVTTDTAVSEINGWVNEKTDGKISSVITEDNTDFWAMLINAVYFKGRWANEFDPNATKPDIFTSRNGTETSIDFMNRRAWINYAEKSGVKIVELPYLIREAIVGADGNVTGTEKLENISPSMYLMISDTTFDPERILDITELTPTYMTLSVPLFNVEYSTNMNDMLKQLGIEKAFSMGAEFGKMFDSGNMWITDTIHKTYIKVNEEGTEAAAVTAVSMGGSAAPPEPIEVKYNKPFTFVIKDNASGEILFMGEYSGQS